MDGSPRLLLVEDDVAVGDMYQLALERHGWSVVRAFTGREAIRMATTDRPDLIVLDLKLPDGQGSVVIKALRADYLAAKIPIFVLTAYDSHSPESREAARLGARRILEKTSTPPGLLAEIIDLNQEQPQPA